MQLRRTVNKSSISYSLGGSDGKSDIIVSSDGETIPLVPDAVMGSMGAIDIEDGYDYAIVDGWAADVKSDKLPKTVVIFIDGDYFYSDNFNEEKSGYLNLSGSDFRKAGFRYKFPLELFENIVNKDSEIRFFAISEKGMASELKYPEGYKWGKTFKP